MGLLHMWSPPRCDHASFCGSLCSRGARQMIMGHVHAYEDVPESGNKIRHVGDWTERPSP